VGDIFAKLSVECTMSAIAGNLRDMRNCTVKAVLHIKKNHKRLSGIEGCGEGGSSFLSFSPPLSRSYFYSFFDSCCTFELELYLKNLRIHHWLLFFLTRSRTIFFSPSEKDMDGWHEKSTLAPSFRSSSCKRS